MTTLNIEGHTVDVDDSFLKLSPEEQNSTVDEIHKSIAGSAAPSFDRGDPRFSEGSMASSKAVEGVPFLGGLTQKAGAAVSALAHPLTGVGSDGATLSERYSKNLSQENAASDTFEKEHPIESGVSKAVGGTLALAPIGGTALGARALGLTGETLAGRAAAGAASGAAIGGGDAAVRGEDPVTGAVMGGILGGAAAPAGKIVGKAVSAIADRVRPEAPRIPRTIDINGNQITVPESHVNPDNLVGSQEQQAISGVLGPEAQRVAQTANEATHDQTQAAAQDFGDQMRGGPGPSQPQADKPVAAGQTITELAQQHNDQIAAQVRHDAQLAAEGTSLRTGLNSPLGAPEPVQTPTAGNVAANAQQAIQERAATSRQGVTNAYNATTEHAGELHPAAFGNIGESIRNQVRRPGAPGVRPVTVNPQLTPNSSAMLDMLDNRIGNNYYENALERGDMIRTPDGRSVPRPLTTSDIEAARQEMVGHLQDARNVQRQGSSGTDAYAAQRIMDAFDRHLDTVMNTPGAFSGDGPAYLASIRAARAAHAQHRATFSNQGAGDAVGQTVEKIIGRRAGQPMPEAQVANTIYGSQTAPGGGNSHQVMGRVRDILGPNSPEFTAVKNGIVSHLTDTPEGVDALSPAQQANRIHSYLATPHAREFYTPEEQARLRAHAEDLRAQARPEAPTTTVQREASKLATEGNATDVIQKVFAKSGEINAGSEHLIQEIKNRVSQPTFNSIRQAMWQHLLEKPEGMVEWGPRELSNRISRFLESPASKVMYDDGERGVMRQFQQHYAKLAPLPNTANSSGSAVMGAKLVRSMGNHIGAMLGSGVGGALGGPIVGHLAGAAIGEGVQRAAASARNARQVAMAKDLFLGQKPARPVKPVYSSKVARLIAQSALSQSGQKQSQP